jgi:hypothetical protein
MTGEHGIGDEFIVRRSQTIHDEQRSQRSHNGKGVRFE